MLVATWNVNSIRAREARVLAWLEARRPDVVCLQELKVADEELDAGPLEALGYHVAAHGQPTYNGVAILSRTEPLEVLRGLGDGVDDPQARLVAVRLATSAGELWVGSAYCPNGGEVGSDKWHYKLAWFERLRAWLERHFDSSLPLVLGGDYNVAPDERDVQNPERWASSVLFHPEARAALGRVTAWGLEDAFRLVHDEAGVYSWWDYRRLAFPKNDGLRIDHLLVTEPLVPRVREVVVDRDERKGQKPSDHAPVVATLELELLGEAR